MKKLLVIVMFLSCAQLFPGILQGIGDVVSDAGHATADVVSGAGRVAASTVSNSADVAADMVALPEEALQGSPSDMDLDMSNINDFDDVLSEDSVNNENEEVV